MNFTAHGDPSVSIYPTSETSLVPFLTQRIIHNFTFTTNNNFAVTYGAVLILGFCRRDGLNKVEMGFGVHEVFDLLDLQASIFVGGDLYDVDRFPSRINSDRGFYLIGTLWGGARLIKQTRCGVDLKSGIRT